MPRTPSVTSSQGQLSRDDAAQQNGRAMPISGSQRQAVHIMGLQPQQETLAEFAQLARRKQCPQHWKTNICLKQRAALWWPICGAQAITCSTATLHLSFRMTMQENTRIPNAPHAHIGDSTACWRATPTALAACLCVNELCYEGVIAKTQFPVAILAPSALHPPCTRIVPALVSASDSRGFSARPVPEGQTPPANIASSTVLRHTPCHASRRRGREPKAIAASRSNADRSWNSTG